MVKIHRTASAIHHLLCKAPEHYGSRSGFQQRRSKLTPALFVQSLVLGWMSNRHASRSALAQVAGYRGLHISPQAISDRFTAAAVSLLRSLLNDGLALSIRGDRSDVELLRRFNGVYLFDTTSITLPKELSMEYSGCGTRGGSSAAMKLHACFDLLSGQLRGPEITEGRRHDACSQLVEQPVDVGSLVLQDLGYYRLDRLARLSAEGVYWLSRYKHGTHLFDGSGSRIDLLQCANGQNECDLAVFVGHKRVAARLLLQRVDRSTMRTRRKQLWRKAAKHGSHASNESLALCAYTIVITNVPVEIISLSEAMRLLRSRWQIELLFKLWKSHGKIDQWQSQRPIAILCELYAKLIALLLEHWVLLSGLWSQADRSLFKAAKVVAQGAMLLAIALDRPRTLSHMLQHIVDAQMNGSTIEKRRLKLSTFQLLALNT